MKPQTIAHKPRVDANWRRWIAENLMLGSPAPALTAVLVSNGIGAVEAHAEIQAAMQSPYLQGARRLANRVAKRDWVLNIQSQLNRLGDDTIARRERLSGADFLQHAAAGALIYAAAIPANSPSPATACRTM